MTADWARARAIADAVLYEGYLLYPYRANSRKNQTRWQFGVLGPAGAVDAGIGEDDSLSAQVHGRAAGQAQRYRSWCASCSCSIGASRRTSAAARYEPVDELVSGAQSWVRWDEAVEREISFGPIDIESDLPQDLPIEIDAGTDIETVDAAGWSAAVAHYTRNWRSPRNPTTGSCA